jgi:hypothetical protein
MPRNRRSDETKLNPATSSTFSLRTTIPSFIVSSKELGKGDRFRWKISGDKLEIEIIRAGEKE